MLDAISQMRRARIGRPRKWQRMAGKISSGVPLSPDDLEYYARLTRIYKEPERTEAGHVRGNYHTALSDMDASPGCVQCGMPSRYYCHMNDQYLCEIHVVGHDPNER